MPKFHVARSITIDVPSNKVRDSLSDFRQWPAWSPWLITEPDAKLKYSDIQGEIGASYAWSGNLVGVGRMELVNLGAEKLEMRLEFQKPFKSKADVFFELKSTGDGTQVTWNMHGALPFFMFFMLKSMKVWIGMDYERGLRMLKEYLETEDVASAVVIEGVVDVEPLSYLGIPDECALEKMPETMAEHFGKLMSYQEDNALVLSAPPFALYTRFDPLKNHTAFISALPVQNTATEPPKGFINKQLPAGKALKVTHTGRYEHLGNAWAAAINFARSNKLKNLKSPVGVEFYISDPRQTAAEDLISEVYVFLK